MFIPSNPNIFRYNSTLFSETKVYWETVYPFPNFFFSYSNGNSKDINPYIPVGEKNINDSHRPESFMNIEEIGMNLYSNDHKIPFQKIMKLRSEIRKHNIKIYL
jgi:hypothetical protein